MGPTLRPKVRIPANWRWLMDQGPGRSSLCIRSDESQIPDPARIRNWGPEWPQNCFLFPDPARIRVGVGKTPIYGEVGNPPQSFFLDGETITTSGYRIIIFTMVSSKRICKWIQISWDKFWGIDFMKLLIYRPSWGVLHGVFLAMNQEWFPLLWSGGIWKSREITKTMADLSCDQENWQQK